jgi:hypothetical protein
MGRNKQAGKNLRRAFKQRMLDRGEMTVRELAKIVGHDESVVSKAIRHGKFPRVREKIRETLDV